MNQPRGFFIVMWIIIVVIGSCSHDKGVQPNPKPPEKDYMVYSIDTGWGDWIQGTKFYGYHTLTGVIDTFIISGHDCRANGCAISPDGLLMYLYDGSSFLTVDLATKETVAEHPSTFSRNITYPMLISPNGAFLAMQGQGFNILSLPDFAVVFSDTVQLANGYFTSDNRYFYGGAFINGSLSSYRVDLGGDFAVTTWIPPYGGAYMTVPSPDYETLFLYIWIYDELFYFCVHDIAGESLIYAQELLPGFGGLTPTPDGRYLIITQQSPLGGDYPSPMRFTVFDIQQNRVFREISTDSTTEEFLHISSDMGYIAITPDGSHLVNEWYGRIFDFDLKTMKYKQSIRLGGTSYLAYTTCQSQP